MVRQVYGTTINISGTLNRSVMDCNILSVNSGKTKWLTLEIQGEMFGLLKLIMWFSSRIAQSLDNAMAKNGDCVVSAHEIL